MTHKKVLVLSASAGAGHVRAAQAIEKAFHIHAPQCDVRHFDTLEYTNQAFRRIYSETYIDLVNKAPEMLGLLYDFLDQPFKNDRLRFTFDRLNTKPFRQMLEDFNPDAAVCTHFLPSEIISWLKYKERLDTKLSVVVTDFDVHAMWLCQQYERFFVAMDETKVHLEKLGMPSDKITVSGIPIDPLFAQRKDKHEMRRKHGLDPELITILVSAGGFGVGPVEGIFDALTDVKKLVQAVFVCGKSAELRQKLERLASAASDRVAVRFKIMGFTSEMDELMSASDILLGKPGGLTTSEALAKGLIFVIVNPIPGQEERNSDHLLEEGVGIRCNNLPALGFKLERLLDDPERMRKMREQSLRLARPQAAHLIAQTVLRQIS